MTTATTTHLLYDGQGGWIEAVAVEVLGEPGWRFKDARDAVRWLRA